ncbi:uncharacterized protein LOC119738149 [Patiria miniata]|uniref:Uncharacterized protein n=1 Tax=Patiria miniata TaxID=46514 RepID=A0A914AYQ1_PATMI|nr:uncharacterized protein LOC119738149 [Patiria miniata]
MDAHQQNLEQVAGPCEHLTAASPVDDIDSICSELEHVELTEEETASLLSDALELNKRLKEELRRQELEERKGRDGMRNSKRRPANDVGRRGDAVSASLPPINPKKGLSVTQRRIYNSVEIGGGSQKMKTSKTSSAMQRKTHSADGSQRLSSSLGHSRSRGTQSAESKQRPEWNDRFSF